MLTPGFFQVRPCSTSGEQYGWSPTLPFGKYIQFLNTAVGRTKEVFNYAGLFKCSELECPVLNSQGMPFCFQLWGGEPPDTRGMVFPLHNPDAILEEDTPETRTSGGSEGPHGSNMQKTSNRKKVLIVYLRSRRNRRSCTKISHPQQLSEGYVFRDNHNDCHDIPSLFV